MRELTLSRVEHPQEMPSGAAVLVDPLAMDQLLDRLQGGDPTAGWAGDPRLSLAYHRPSQRWELWRLEATGQYSIVSCSRPGYGFPPNLIANLVYRDTRRGYDVKRDVDDHNDALNTTKETAQGDKLAEMSDRLARALRRDLGHLYG